MNYYRSKKHKRRYKIKKLLYKAIGNQNTKKSPGIEGVLFNCTGKMGMDNFGCLNSSLFLFLFCNEHYGVPLLTADSPFPQTNQ